MHNKNFFLKKKCRCCSFLDLNLKAIFSRYIRAVGELSEFENKDFDLNWNSLQSIENSIFRSKKNEIVMILKNIRNYNAHFFYNEDFFIEKNEKEENVQNILRLLNDSSSKVSFFNEVNFFDKLINQIRESKNEYCKENQCCKDNKLKMAKWNFMFFTSSLILYSSEYKKLKEQIKNFLKNQQKYLFESSKRKCSCFKKYLEIFETELKIFETELKIKIMKNPIFIKESDDLFIINEIAEITKKQFVKFLKNDVINFYKKLQEENIIIQNKNILNKSKKTKKELKTKLSLNKIVRIIDNILKLNLEKKEYELKLQISEKLYCYEHKKINHQSEELKEETKLKTKNCFKCKRYWNEKTKNLKWYIEKPIYQIYKNMWRFHIIYKKETKIVVISKKVLQKFLLRIFWFWNNLKNNNPGKEQLINNFQKKFHELFIKIIHEDKNLDVQEKFINHLKKRENTDLSYLKKESNFNFLNRTFIKKYKYEKKDKQNEKKFTTFSFDEKYQISVFLNERKMHKINKLESLLSNLKIESKKTKNDSKIGIYSCFSKLFNNVQNIETTKILRIRMKFILQTLNSEHFLNNKLQKKHFQNLFKKFFKQINLDFRKINLLKILEEIKFIDKNESKNLISKIKKEVGIFQYSDDNFDRSYHQLIKHKIELLKKQIKSTNYPLSDKNINNFCSSVLKLNNVIKINCKWLDFFFPHEINGKKLSLNEMLNDDDETRNNEFKADKINEFLTKSLNLSQKKEEEENIKEILNKLNNLVTTKNKIFTNIFTNKCELILHFFLYELLKEYSTTSLKKSNKNNVSIREKPNFIESHILYKIKGKKQGEEIYVIFKGFKNFKIKYLYLYNLYTWDKISKFIENNFPSEIENNKKEFNFTDLEKYIDKIYDDKTKISFRAWKIIKWILEKERKKYQDSSEDEKSKLQKNKYLSFNDLFHGDHKEFKELRNSCLHMNTLTKQDFEIFKKIFPEKYEKLQTKYK